MMLQRQKHIALAWGLLHGINDWTAGYIISSYSLHHTMQQNSTVLIVYALIGFGGQLPVAILLDKQKSLTVFINASLGFLFMTLSFSWVNDWLAVMAAGLSSAFLHVTGGAICLQASKEKIGPLGLFTAPGVLGLALGIACGDGSRLWIVVAIALLAIVLLRFTIRCPDHFVYRKQTYEKKQVGIPEGHDWLMIGILLTVTLRSLVYDIIEVLGRNWEYGLLVIGSCAFIGKLIGGFIADKIGWRLWVYISLPLALLFLALGKDNLLLLGAGVAFLQSSVPLSLWLMCRSMPRFPATSAAFVLGTGICIPGLIFFVVNETAISKLFLSETGIAVSLIVFVVIALATISKRGNKAFKSN